MPKPGNTAYDLFIQPLDTIQIIEIQRIMSNSILLKDRVR
ncbi:hypothetical protein JM79_1592 [Gramella sp. Hel_I_59]|nr:hypothetical protein JM79_1592 [Gramella sp. Hel_I_59]